MAEKGMSVFAYQGEDYTINDPNNAPEFDATAANAKGDYVYYQGDLYRFDATHAANTTWANRSKTKVKLGAELLSEITSRKNAVSNLKSVVDGLVSVDDDAFLYCVNLFDKNAATDGEKITGTGYVEGYYPTMADEGWYTSDYIPVNEGDVVHISKVRRCLGYTANNERSATEYILNNTSGIFDASFTVPATIKYIRFGGLIADKNDVVMTLNNDLPAQYVPFNQAKVDTLKENVAVAYPSIGESKDYLFNRNNVSVFGSATYKDNVITILNTNGGVQTAFFNKNQKIEVHLDADITMSSVRIQLGYKNSQDEITYEVVGRLLPTDDDISVVIDLPYYAVYHDAKSFQIIVNTGASSGTIKVNEFHVRLYSEVETVSFYDKTFPGMMKKLDSQISNMGDKLQGIIMGSPSGEKFRVQIYNDGLTLIPTIPGKTVILGNSLLRGFHDETNDTYFGMCASDAEKDFFYYVKQAITEKNNYATVDKSSCVGLEQAETATAQTTWLNGQIAAGYISSDKDLIIIQIGDNVNNATRRSVFASGFGDIIGSIKGIATHARVVLVGVWFSHPDVVSTIKKAAKDYDCDFVDISQLNTPENQGYHGQVITWSDGTQTIVDDAYITHPGDRGFELIAEEILKVLDM